MSSVYVRQKLISLQKFEKILKYAFFSSFYSQYVKNGPAGQQQMHIKSNKNSRIYLDISKKVLEKIG